ncbi:hypothetical protein WN51_14428 [Melipona quadrifasciata]|uniref:Uncharacterized protein n=1 Tax=Melipona quadrifasciata TaxID=166423 RepID=A0A0N0U558_9HYME|nr:hypothetical protein WN51_14428 [Melipona quadrifasciata]
MGTVTRLYKEVLDLHKEVYKFIINITEKYRSLREDNGFLFHFAASQAVRSKDNEKIIGSQSLYTEGNCLSECSLDLDLYLTRNPVPPDFENTRWQYILVYEFFMEDS